MPIFRHRIIYCLLLFVLLGALSPRADADSALSPGAATFQQMQNTIMTVSDTVKMSVVHIEVVARRGDRQMRALGSGLIVDKDGTIVTNAHVVDNAQEITVILPDDTTKYMADVINSDQQTDLAVIRIKAPKPLAAATLGNSDAVQVGEWVLAIGNPYGFDRTVSFGIISGKGRVLPDRGSEVQLLNDFIQTDALIDPGSSGGPLVNLQGEVLGINSVGVGRGQGFTIPSNVVKDVLKKSLSQGGIERGWLGVYTQAFPREMAAYFGLPGRQGILVSDVEPGSPAAAGGLRTGDIITAINGTAVTAEREEDLNRFTQIITNMPPGATVNIGYVRAKTPAEATIVLAPQPKMVGKEYDTDLGFTVKEITIPIALEYRLDDTTGVLVFYVTSGSDVNEAGLTEGDVIVKVDDLPIADLEGFKKALDSVKAKASYLLTTKRGRLLRYVLIEAGKAKSRPGTPAP